MPNLDAAPVLVVCGDFGSERCGVGASEAAFAATLTEDVEVIDPCAAWRSVIGDLRSGGRRQARVLIVYPTRSTATSAHALLSLGLAMFLVPRRRRAVHLHEYAIFHEIRWYWNVLLALRGGDVVVSRRSDAAMLGGALRGLVARRCRIHVIPAVNGTAPPPGWSPTSRRHPPVTVGIFGRWSPERGDGPPVDILRALPPSVTGLELIGEGWDTFEWPADVRDRMSITALGPVANRDLPAAFANWDLALTPLVHAAHDARMSLRTPLAFGVPTITSTDDPADLTLRPAHLLLSGDGLDLPDVDLPDVVALQGARQVAAFEADAARRIADLVRNEGGP